jgi:hypothetical protein
MSELDSVVVMVSNRPQLLNQFMVSLVDHQPGRPIFIHLQGGEEARREVVFPKGLVYDLLVSERSLGCHAARVLALRDLGGQGFKNYINVDDDVTLIPQTNWQPAIDKSNKEGMGFVLTNWIKHHNGLEKAIGIMTEEFLSQVMVYNGGGMAYDNDIANLMRDLDPVPARYDDIWPLTAYLNGYRNYRYRGSLAVHAIMGKGGMTAYMRSEPKPLLCQKWINYRLLTKQPVGSEYSIPMDSDLKPIARITHRAAREEKGWS